MQTLECFPTPIWSREADNKNEINQELFRLISELREEDKHGVEKTNSGGWQSNTIDLNVTPLFKELILGFTQEVIAALNVKPKTQIVLGNCWINANGKGSYNRAHTHPNSMLSGCYYLKTPKGSGDIVFTDPRAQATCLLFPTVEKNKYTVPSVRFHPQSGSIILFPSWLNHYVDANNSEEERISIAFNIVLVD